MSRRQWVRVAISRSVLAKKFAGNRTRARNLRDHQSLTSAAVVVIDLKNGCLDSLDPYLRQHKGVPDRAVAVALRQLISGSRARSRYRLIAIDHPDNAAPVKPKKRAGDSPTATQVKQAAAYREAIRRGDQPEYAAENAAQTLKTSASAIFRSVKIVESYERHLADERAGQEERAQALADSYRRADQALARLAANGDRG